MSLNTSLVMGIRLLPDFPAGALMPSIGCSQHAATKLGAGRHAVVVSWLSELETITEAADDRSTTAPIASASDQAWCLSANLSARAILRLSGGPGPGSKRDRWRWHRQ